MPTSNKRKIINDPVYGFITIPDELTFDVIEHPWFQRLRRIKQLGLTHLVYPGALHTRFHHAIGALYLARLAVESLRLKGHEISPDEESGVALALLLHDIGHGPFSHALEHTIVYNTSHELLSLLFMNRLNEQFSGALTTAISIFKGEYPKGFLHQLVTGQLDMDRMDYLKRDSFYTGVSEGVISADRILHMLNIAGDELVVEAKGIYSVEKFIVARRLMYWQVYLHKTVLVAEQMLVHLLRRAVLLAKMGAELFSTPSLGIFMHRSYTREDFLDDADLLGHFAELDDYDIFSSVKVWASHPDKVLSSLSRALVNRNLFRIEIRTEPYGEDEINEVAGKLASRLGLQPDEIPYFLYQGCIANDAYNPEKDKIKILRKDGSVADIMEDSAQLNVQVLSGKVTKYYLACPKGLLT